MSGKRPVRIIEYVGRTFLLFPPSRHPQVSGMRFSSLCRSFAADERGLETVEYAILVGLVVGGTVAVLGAIGSWVVIQYNKVPH